MARALPVSPFEQSQDTDPATPSGDWQELRSELVALLDEVEGRYAGPAQPAGGYAGLARRVDELRRQVDAPAGHRHREALASVKRAVDRFNEHDEPESAVVPPPQPANPRDVLQSAIREIRARQQAQAPAPRMPARAEAPAHPAIDELARSVTGLTSRLTQVESEIRASRAEGGDIHEVADQVSQLTHVVELLAGAVGETGQVKRLEVQIAELAATLETVRQPDVCDITQRLDDLSHTVDRLADIQIQHFGRDAKDGPTRAAALTDGMQAIETSVRNVYDRIDAIERNLGAPSAEIERLTEALATFTQAMHEQDSGPDRLLPLVETINERLAGFEGQGGAASGLKSDIGALRSAVVEAMEPRFSAIEERIDALNDRIGDGRGDTGTAGIEAQIRQLVNRMDQTGEQLAGLAKLYGKDERPQPDMEALASLVARKTSEAVGTAAPQQDLTGMQSGIRKVDERLERLEAALARLNTEAPATPRPSVRIPGPPAAGDGMPSNPSDDRPLIDKGPSEHTPLRPAPDEPSRAPHSRSPMGEAPAAPRIDPAGIALPPRPVSAFDDARRDEFADSPEPEKREEPALDNAGLSSRNTFIEAARRAAQRQASAKPEPTANSLIGRALSRFQPGETAPAAPAVEKAPTKPEKKSRRERKAEARAAAEAEAAMAPPAPVADEDEAEPSFLSRHRRPILLAAALVAVSFLALNLVAQRLNSTERVVPSPAPAPAATDTITPPAEPAEPAPAPEAAAPATPAPAAAAEKVSAADAIVLPAAAAAATAVATDSDGIDDVTVGSINPDAAMNFTSPGEIASMPPVLRAASLGSGALDPEPLASPVKVDPPPEGLGPAELRDAAANGDARAQFEVAAIYTEGRAIPQDLAAAAKWYERAAAQGFVPAEYRLGSLYEAGKGVDKDIEQARLWYQRAAEAGNRMSMHNLAALYAGGNLGKQDFASAAEWFEQAAMRGLTDSQFNLGMLYARGLGVPQSFEKSYKWFALAAKSGDADAAKARDDVAKSLNADQMAALQTEIDTWKATPIDLPANFAPIGTWSEHFDAGNAISDKQVVEKVQQVLARLGYDIGTPDGLAGPKTAEAIKAFEHATGMSETGAVNPRLLAVLGSQPV